MEGAPVAPFQKHGKEIFNPKLYAEKVLAQPVLPCLLTLCPTMNLIAVATSEKQLEVFRHNGQRALAMKRPAGNAIINRIDWFPDGHMISVIWDDGVQQDVDSAIGKHPIMFLIRAPGSSEIPALMVTSHGYEYHLANKDIVKASSIQTSQHSSGILDMNNKPSTVIDWAHPNGQKGITSDEFLAAVSEEDVVQVVSDLPRQLALIDIEEDLPALSTLPHTEDPHLPLVQFNDHFCSQELLKQEVAMNSPVASNKIFASLACWSNGRITTRIERNFWQSDSRLIQRLATATNEIVAQASHPFSVCHALLVQRKVSLPKPDESDSSISVGLYLNIWALHQISDSGCRIMVLRRQLPSLILLTDYMRHCIVCIRTTWTTCQDLPTRFIKNINDTLAEEMTVGVVAALFHLAVSGDCFAPVKEWLTNELSERGYRRWDQAVTSGYQKIVELVHENLLPALERASVIASHLRGLSRSHDIPNFESEVAHLTSILDNLDILRLLAHNILSYATVELRQFRVFSGWLLQQIRLLAADADSAAEIEAAEKVAEMDLAQLLVYIQGALTESKLNVFLNSKTDVLLGALKQFSSSQVTRQVLLSKLDRHRHGVLLDQEAAEENVDEPQTKPSIYAVDLLYHTLLLSQNVRAVRDRMATTAIKLVKTGNTILAYDQLTDKRDVRMKFNDEATTATYVLTVPEANRNRVRIHQVVHDKELRPLHTALVYAFELQLGAGEVKDLKFLDDDVFLALLQTQDSTRLLWLPYSVHARAGFHKTHKHMNERFTQPVNMAPGWENASTLPLEHADYECLTCDLADSHWEQQYSQLVLHTFSHPNGVGEFVPDAMQASSREDKRTVVLLERERTRYRVYDLPDQGLRWADIEE